MTTQAQWLVIYVVTALVVGIMFGLRLATTLDSWHWPQIVIYIPVHFANPLGWTYNSCCP